MRDKASRFSVVILLLVSILLPTINHLPSANGQTPAVVNDNPIRGENSLITPSGVTYIDTGDYILWSHVTPENEINETETVSYYFEINSQTLGSTGIITLEIVDKLFSFEPDLDLYLYNPNGDLVDSSENEGDDDEIIIVDFNQTGIWEVLINGFDGDGFYILLRDVYSNSAPEIINENLNTDNPYVFDPVFIDACETYDPDGHEINFTWFVDGNEITNDDDEDGVEDCSYGFEITSESPVSIRFIVEDEYGLSSEDQMTITPSNPGWNTLAMGTELSVDVDESIQFTFYDMAPPMQTPIRSEDGMPITLQVGLRYDIIVESDFAVRMAFEHDTGLEHTLDMIDENIDHYSQEVFFKPSLVFVLKYGTTEYSLDIPMLSNEELYPSQPFFSLENYSFNLFYWADYIQIDTTSLIEFYEFSSFQEFTLASIDLYPILEWMIDNLATALGQGWVDTATNLLSKLIDISIPLEFNVDIFAYGVNFVQTKPTCDTCTIASMMNNGPADFGDYSNTSSISFDSDYDLKVAIGVLSYFYVEATPNIDISLELNSIEIWTMELFEFATLENDFVSSNPSNSHILFSHIVDSDNDGVGDSEDFLPLDSSQQIDSDGDGCGDNQTGTNGDQFPDDSSECSDQDLDGVGDNSDAFPTDANESKDSDNDGVGDNADKFPADANESLDSDNDGIGDNSDKCDDTKTDDNIDSEGCVIISTSSTSSNQNLVITAGASVLILIIIAVLIFIIRGKNDDALVDDFSSEMDESYAKTPPPIESAPQVNDTEIPHDMVGELDANGYYWTQWPTDSGIWYYRTDTSQTWVKHQS